MCQTPQVLLQDVRDTAKCGKTVFADHPWDAWLCGFSLVIEMAEKDGVHKTNGDLCIFQLATNSIDKGSWFMATTEMDRPRITCISLR